MSSSVLHSDSKFIAVTPITCLQDRQDLRVHKAIREIGEIRDLKEIQEIKDILEKMGIRDIQVKILSQEIASSTRFHFGPTVIVEFFLLRSSWQRW